MIYDVRYATKKRPPLSPPPLPPPPTSSSSSPLPSSSSSSSPLSVSVSMSPSSPLTPGYPIGHQIDSLCDTKSANVSSRKKEKKTYSPFQQTDGKVEEQGLSRDEHDTPQCVSYAGAVAIDDAGKELVRGNRKRRVRPDKHQHSQNEKKTKRTWRPCRLRTRGPVPPLSPRLEPQ